MASFLQHGVILGLNPKKSPLQSCRGAERGNINGLFTQHLGGSDVVIL